MWFEVSELPESPTGASQRMLEYAGVPRDEQADFQNLEEPERRFVWSLWSLAYYYDWRRFLQDGRDKETLVKRCFRDIDEHWIKSGQGRAVAFKRALRAMLKYEEYYGWAREMEVCSYEFLIPYRIKQEVRSIRNPHLFFRHEGVLKLCVEYKNVLVAKLGEVRYDAHITIDELELHDRPGELLERVVEPHRTLQETYDDTYIISQVTLVNLVSRALHLKLAGDPELHGFAYSHRENQGNGIIAKPRSLQISFPDSRRGQFDQWFLFKNLKSMLDFLTTVINDANELAPIHFEISGDRIDIKR